MLADENGLPREPVAHGNSAFHYLEIVRDLGHLAEHDRGRAVFFGGELHGLFNALGVQPLARDGEVDVDPGEDLGVGVGALGGQVGDAVGDPLAALAKDVDDVEGGAVAQPDCSISIGRTWRFLPFVGGESD